jgi:pentatricopeptide repeat protein
VELCYFSDDGDEAQASTVKPSHMTFHHMLYGWGNARDPMQGVTTLEAMRAAGLEPTQTAYRLAIEGCVPL